MGPGLRDWRESRSVLAGTEPYVSSPTALTASPLLPAAERRRIGIPVKLALAAAQEACAHSGRDPASVATVFTSSSGDGETVHHIFESLALPGREVSPTRFHNSVHNAAAGYWSIATQSRQPSTSLCCYDTSFGAGLLDAATQASVDNTPVALIAYDHPYPEPLHSKRPVCGAFAVAFVLAPQLTERTLATIELTYSAGPSQPAHMSDPGLEALRAGIPAARSLPFLAALARQERGVIVFELSASNHLSTHVAPTIQDSERKHVR
ncbi:MAG: beta-ketoacyl synthase chain length factor [Burkholderiales bacterium]